MLPRAAPPELAALVIGPVCALATTTSVFAPYAPNGNLRWGFYALALVFGVASIGVLRARTMRSAALRAPMFASFFAVTGGGFVYWSEPLSRISGERVYPLANHAFTAACVVVVTTAIMLAIAWPVLRRGKRRALDHGEGLVTAYATLAIPFGEAIAQYGNGLANRRWDAIAVTFALTMAALVAVLVVRWRRLRAWRGALRGENGLEVVPMREGDAAVPALFRAIADADMCIVHASRAPATQVGYREGDLRTPLARVRSQITPVVLARASLPLAPLAVWCVAFLAPAIEARSLGVPRAVSEYEGGKTEVHRPYFVAVPRGWHLWRLDLPGPRYWEHATIVGVDPSGRFHDGADLVTSLAATGLDDTSLDEVVRLALLRQAEQYVPDRPPCARTKEGPFAHREGDAFVFCTTSPEPTPNAPSGLRLHRYRVSLATGALAEEATAWLPDDGSIEDAARR